MTREAPKPKPPLANPPDHPRPGILTLDFSLNLGHILQLAAMLVGGVVAWKALDTRVTVLEEHDKARVTLEASKDARRDESLAYIKEQVTELRRVVERLNDKVDEGGRK